MAVNPEDLPSPEDIQVDQRDERKRRIPPKRFSIPEVPVDPLTEEEEDAQQAFLDALNERFDSTPYISEMYDKRDNLIVGEGYTVYTPEQRLRIQAHRVATDMQLHQNNDLLAIALDLSPAPEDEDDEEEAERLEETQDLALQLAGTGEFSVAIVLGYLPSPKVEPQPRMVDASGNLVQEEILIEF